MKLEQRLALVGYLRKVFGVYDIHDKASIREYYKEFNRDTEGATYDADGLSKVYKKLLSHTRVSIKPKKLLEYDRNISAHSKKINKNRDKKAQIAFKYFQMLAGFYTEYYLDQLATDKQKFLKELNAFVEQQNKANSKIKYPDFEEDDLNKLAFWMATGSGKTLLLHLNYYQYLHYLPKLGDKPDNMLLITPNAGLTEQHKKELDMSGIPNRYYLDAQTGGGLDEETIKLIEITKLTDEKKGDGDSVEVSSFEGNNLIFVDEGHKGSSTDDSKWMKRRKAIAKDGFTFEYSATFGQALNKAATSVQDEYGKSILFDYSYPRFFDDGYGKNYKILNLRKQQNFDDQQVQQTYLLANLLSFYEQKYVFNNDEHTFFKTWNIHEPLLTFIGHSVQAGKTKSGLATDEKRTISDVQKLVLFLNTVLQNDKNWSVNTIQKLLVGESGVQNPDGEDVFAKSFDVLKTKFKDKPGELYAQLLQELFHIPASAPLKLTNIKSAEGEIGLRAGNSDQYFGVINIGEDSVFLQFVEEHLPDLIVEENDAFQDSLFQQINKQHSPINILIGSKKFIEGWSSWRVTNMGLLNIGKSEGSQIIQLFGRGVRLLGKERSLLRSSAMKNESLPANIELLETLQIFGMQANYMEQFRKYLKEEGIDVDERVQIDLDIKFPNEFENKGLLVIEKKIEHEFTDVVQLVLEVNENIKPKIDLTNKIEAEISEDTFKEPSIDKTFEAIVIPEKLFPLLNFDRLYREAWYYRNQKGYSNLSFNTQTLHQILKDKQYDLYCDDSLLEVGSFSDISKIEEIALIILRKYIDLFYKQKQQAWEYTQLEYQDFDKNNKNIPKIDGGSAGYQLSVKKAKVEEIQKEIKAMIADAEIFNKSVESSNDGKLLRIYFDRHIYLPLLLEDTSESIKSMPPGLNKGEREFLKHLRAALDNEQTKALLKDYEVYVLRNQSRGHGIGFLLEEGRFFPDFVIWIKNDKEQHICFVDPHGLQHEINVKENDKVQFAKDIKQYEDQLNEKRGSKEVKLHSFIISQTSFEEVKKNNEVQSESELNKMNLYFPRKDGEYIDLIIRSILVDEEAIEYK